LHHQWSIIYKIKTELRNLVSSTVTEPHYSDTTPAPAPGPKFFKMFFTQEGTPHILRFCLKDTVIAPAASQETMGEAGIELGTAALQSGVTQLP
jgi:hypothetical protein